MSMRKRPDFEDPLKPAPPPVLAQREASVALHNPNTLRIPCDPKRDDGVQRWYIPEGTTALRPGANQVLDPMRRITSGNEVLYLIDGDETFAEMARVIRETDGPEDFVFLTGLWFSDDLPMVRGDASSTMNALLREAAGVAAKVQAEKAEIDIGIAADAVEQARLFADQTLTASYYDIYGRTAHLGHQAAVAAYRAISSSQNACKTVGVPPEVIARIEQALATALTAMRAAEAAQSVAPPQTGIFPPHLTPQEQGLLRAAAVSAKVAAGEARLAFNLAFDAAGHAKPLQGRGVQVRALIWDDWGGTAGTQFQFLGVTNVATKNHNTQHVARLNLLHRGVGVLDDRTLSLTSSHHQKILVVHHRGTLTAFVGGLDINPDRMFGTGEPPNIATDSGGADTGGAPFHDVHLRLRGPAAWDVLQVFIRRWQDHPDARLDEAGEDLRGTGLTTGGLARDARNVVQIGCTFGNGIRHEGLDQSGRDAPQVPALNWPGDKQELGIDRPAAAISVPGGYTFARNGEQTIRRMILHAVEQAKRFIYMEDQYMTGPEASRAILARLPYVSKVILLMPPDRYAYMGDHQSQQRALFLAPLLASEHAHKVGVYLLKRQPDEPAWTDWHTNVHNKMWIVDDRFL